MKKNRKHRYMALVVAIIMISLLLAPCIVFAEPDTSPKYYVYERTYIDGTEYGTVTAYNDSDIAVWKYQRAGAPETAPINAVTQALGLTSEGFLFLTQDQIVYLDEYTGDVKKTVKIGEVDTDSYFMLGPFAWFFDNDENLYLSGCVRPTIKFDKDGNIIAQNNNPGAAYYILQTSDGSLRFNTTSDKHRLVFNVDPQTLKNDEDLNYHIDFEDVSADDWFCDAVNDIVDVRGYMNGMSSQVFGPAVTLSRAQFATILYRMEASMVQHYPKADYSNPFSDVAEGAWYEAPVLWANKAGVVTGYADGRFGPADPITREQMVTMMYRFAQHNGIHTDNLVDISGYPDASEVSSWAETAMRWAVANKVISGKNGGQYLDPKGTASRAECAQILCNMLSVSGISDMTSPYDSNYRVIDPNA